MTVDERIERLTERTEALTQSVELLSHMHQDNEKKYTAMFEQLSNQQGRILTVVEQLSMVAADYGKPIQDLENRE